MSAPQTKTLNTINDSHSILLFDGVCNFCSGKVAFVLQRDPEGVFRFAALQSVTGQDLLERYGLPRDQLETMVLIRGESVYQVRRRAGNRTSAKRVMVPALCIAYCAEANPELHLRPDCEKPVQALWEERAVPGSHTGSSPALSVVL
jgi:hypothetical protein